jgi:hypothetical protein
MIYKVYWSGRIGSGLHLFDGAEIVEASDFGEAELFAKDRVWVRAFQNHLKSDLMIRRTEQLDPEDKTFSSNTETKQVDKIEAWESAFPHSHEGAEGLTKREYFAAIALQGLLSNSGQRPQSKERFAEMAVSIADALLQELGK